jgi:Divergent InlB B-repeat domain
MRASGVTSKRICPLFHKTRYFAVLVTWGRAEGARGGIVMGRRLFVLLLLAVMTASCTAILGDFDTGSGSNGGDSGIEPDSSSGADVAAIDAQRVDAGDAAPPVDAPLDVPTVDAAGNVVSVTLAGNGAGNVTSIPSGIDCGHTCSANFAGGTKVTLTAVPGNGSTFTGWSGACTGTGACVVTAMGAVAVTATFTMPAGIPITVTKAGAGSGTVTSAPAGIACGSTCTGSFTAGQIVTLTATPATGSIFTGWSGGLCTGTGTCVVTASVASTVIATFDLTQVTITITKTGAGTVAGNAGGINCGTTCTATVPYNTAVTLTAAPTSPAVFSGWSGGGCSGTNACVVTVTAPVTVNAVFSNTFYVIEDDTAALQQIVNPDTATPSVAAIGPLGVTFAFGDCAYDSGNKNLYMVDGRGAKALYTLNTQTGAATLVGVHGITDVFALGYYPPGDALYGVGICASTSCASGYGLYKFNVTTGAATLVGNAAYTNGLAWDSKRSLMMSITSSGGFNTINVGTGAVTSVGGSVLTNNNGMTYDPLTDKFWEATYNGQLGTADPNNTYTSTAFSIASIGIHTAICYILP